MFLVVAVLLAIGEKSAASVLAWFGPCLNWVAKWLPLFYVASLVVLPLNLAGIAGEAHPATGQKLNYVSFA
jgi:hypothetical protein